MSTSNAGRPFSRRTRRLAAATAVATAVLGAVAPSALADNGDTIDGRFSAQGLRSAGSVLELDVAGRAGIPGDAVAVSLNLTVTQSTGPGYATVYPCGSRRPDASTVNFATGATIANGVIAPVGSGGRVCIYTSVRSHVIADVSGSIPSGVGYRAQNPERMLDTRAGSNTVDGRFAAVGRRRAGRVLELDVAGRGSVPGNPDAVALNITVTETAGPGFATVFPCGSTRPEASTINFDRGMTIANGVVASVGDSGRVCIYTSERTHVVADVSGSFTAGYRALNPARLVDTRSGSRTIDGRFAGAGSRAAGRVLELDVAGRGGTPINASAVALNLTVTQAGASGYATLYPCGSSRPAASTINFSTGATLANGVIAQIGSGGRVCIYTSARTHVIADVSGSFTSGYRAHAPIRLLDTRPPMPPPPTPTTESAQHSLTLLNQLRAQYGVGPVAFDEGMSSQALGWSAEMSRSGFRHSSLGYAENIAWHSLSSMSPTQAAAELHKMWVNSPGHFQNMIDSRWTRVGIGLYVDGGGWYGTHVFA